MTNYSQSDPRWANSKIGNTDVLMKTDGCLVTACASLTDDFNPLQALSRLSFSGAQLNWNSIKNIGLELIEREDIAPKDKIMGYVNQYGFCIVRVDWDGSPKTPKDTHFVVYLPNNMMMDPIDGFIKPISTYPLLTGYRAVKKVSISMVDDYSGLDLANVEAMRVAAKVWKDVTDGKYKSVEDYEKMQLHADEMCDVKLKAARDNAKKDLENKDLEMLSLKQQQMAEITELSQRHDAQLKELKDYTAKLEEQLASGGDTLKNRFMSRKFLLTLGSSLVALSMAVATMFGVKVDLSQLEAVMTSFVALIALFVIPEAYTDFKLRMGELQRKPEL